MIDDTIHQKTRLAIMAHLSAVGESDFLSLRKALDLTDGNLSVHSHTLNEAGYIETTRAFVGRKTQTTYRITDAGRKAFQEYVTELESILRGGIGNVRDAQEGD